jgi:hypothetical protein
VAERAEGEPQADGAAMREGYERLREAVLAERPDGFRLGHGVLVTRGMRAWMTAFGALAHSAPEAGAPGVSLAASNPGENNCASVVAAPLPGADRFVAVLAQMALAHAA